MQIQGFYTEETATFKYKRPVKVMSYMHIAWCVQLPACPSGRVKDAEERQP